MAMGFFFATADWQAAGHAALSEWLPAIAIGGQVALVALVLLGIAMAIARRRRYDASAALPPDRRVELSEAIAAAERRTVGEIVLVVLDRSDRHPEAGLLAGIALAAIGVVLLAPSLPLDRPLVWLAVEAACGLAGYGLARGLPDFLRRFVFEKRATGAAHEQALQEFHRYALHSTKDATGVLVLVSLFERRVVVLGDAGIHARVGESHWHGTAEAVLEGVKRGDLASGLREGIERCADVLAEHFPSREGDRNELPNRVVVRRE